MKTQQNPRKAPAQVRALWQIEEPQHAAAPRREQAEAPTIRLAPEIEQLLAELAPFGVQYHPQAPCERCGCPLSYPLTLYPDTLLCCRCYPGGRKYGFDRHTRILTCFPRREAGQWS